MKNETVILLVVAAAVVFFVMKDQKPTSQNTSGTTNNPNTPPSPTVGQQVGGIVADIFSMVDSVFNKGSTVSQSSPSTL